MFVNRIVVALAFIIVFTIMFTSASLAATDWSKTYIYVETDEYDRLFIEEGLSKNLIPNGSIIGISLSPIMFGEQRNRVIVLPDPNFNAEQVNVAKEFSSKVLQHVINGGIAVAGLNGAVLLNLSLSEKSFPLPSTTPEACAPAPASYDYAKYKCIPEPPLAYSQRVLDRVVVYIARIGKGWVIIIPINVVWAYSDSKDPVYVEVFSEALKIAEELDSGMSIQPYYSLIASLIISSTVAFQTTQIGGKTNASSRGGGSKLVKTPERNVSIYVNPLYTRIPEDEALKHPARKKIYDIVSSQGAVPFNALWRITGLSKAAVAWHLSVLERLGMVSMVKYKKYLLVYTPDPEGVEKLIKRLHQVDPKGLCRLAEYAAQNTPLEAVARRIKTSVWKIARVYEIIKSNLDLVEKLCLEK